jgi:hypothetical protein
MVTASNMLQRQQSNHCLLILDDKQQPATGLPYMRRQPLTQPQINRAPHPLLQAFDKAATPNHAAVVLTCKNSQP